MRSGLTTGYDQANEYYKEWNLNVISEIQNKWVFKMGTSLDHMRHGLCKAKEYKLLSKLFTKE
jgi:hypothetical protein